MGLAIFLQPNNTLYVGNDEPPPGDNYLLVHDKAVGRYLAGPHFILTNSYYPTDPAPQPYAIRRGFLHYDTSSLGGAIPTGARYSFWGNNKKQTNVGHSDLHLVEGIQSIPAVLADYGNHLSKTTPGGSIAYASIIVDDDPPDWTGMPNLITLNATGRGWIDPSGITKFCLRLSGDIGVLVPTDDNKVSISRTTYLQAVTRPASDEAGDSATLNGYFEGLGLEVSYVGANPTYPRVCFEYGETVAYGNSTPWQYGTPLFTDISAGITGLLPATTYHFRTVTELSAGDFDYGADETFVTLMVVIPTVTTDPATEVLQHFATPNGTLDDDGGEACDCGFEWGETPAYGLTTPTESKVTGETFSQGVGGLFPGTTYYFRAFATNSAGTGYGADRSFTTPVNTPLIINKAYALSREEL